MSFGFRKGFLLSAKNESKKKDNGRVPQSKLRQTGIERNHANAVASPSHSSELLDFEKFDEVERRKPSSSFLLVQSPEPESSIPTEPSALQSQDVDAFSADHDDTQSGFSIREVWTSKSSPSSTSHVGEGRLTASVPLVQKDSQFDNGNDEVCLPRPQRNDTDPMTFQKNEDDENKDLLPSPCNPDSLRLLSRELNKTLLRRNSNACYDSFVSTYLTSPDAWLYAWPLVLKRIPRDAALELGVRMAMTGLEFFVQVVQQHNLKKETNESKAILLGAAQLQSHLVRTKQLDKLLSSSPNDSDHGKGAQEQVSENLMRLLLVEWVQIVLESQSRRTVLAQEAMLSAYGILSYDIDVNSFEDLLRVHEQWLLSYAGTKRDSWRRQCTLLIIQDWKVTATLLTGNAETLCEEIVAVAGNNDDIKFGGLRHTLIDTLKIDATTILAMLAGAKNSPPATRRSILRGVLAVLGQDKTLWRPDFIHDAISSLLVLLLLDDMKEPDLLCASLLCILLLVSPLEHLNGHVTIIIAALTEQPGKAARIGRPWSDSLLQSTLVDVERYAQVLESVCTQMFSAPDQMAPLVLFGSLVDSKVDASDRISKGVFSVLEVCSRQLEETQNVDDTYRRLAPLLLIRRVPSTLYTSMWMQRQPLPDEHQRVFTVIGIQLSKLLRGGISSLVSPTEQQLAADFVGRCLPFDLDVPYSSFTLVLLPAFRNVAVAIKADDDRVVPSINDAYRPAKIALYVACCQVPLIANEASSGMLAVASFALWLLVQQPRSDADEFINCHLASLEFVAACLRCNVTPITAGLCQIISGQGESLNWLDVSRFGVSLRTEDLKSDTVKLYIWNAYLLESQNTSDVSWAKETAAWILDFLEASLAASPVVPVHIPAALHILFVLITRNKSVDIIPLKDIPKLNRCIRSCLERGVKDNQLAALKLFMSFLVALESGAYESNYQDLVMDADADETLTLVARIAQGDDAEFQGLAKHLFMAKEHRSQFLVNS